MERFEIKEYDLRFVVDLEGHLGHGVNVSLSDKPPYKKEDFYWIDSIKHENIGFTYKVYGLDKNFHGSQLYRLLPILVSDEVLEYYDFFYYNGEIHECCRMYLDEETEKWIVISEEEKEYFESDVKKIVAMPNMFGWVYNEGPPHDHNYDWVDSRYLEVFRDAYLVNPVINNFKLSIVVDAECSNKNNTLNDCIGDLKLKPKLHNGKIIIDGYNLLRNSSLTYIHP